MHTVLAIVIGGLFAAAVYLMLRRSLAKLIIGLSLLTTATNLLILTVGGLTRARPPLVPVGAMRPVEPYADPIPQALILTAIVIGFGVLAFMMALAYRTYNVVGSDDLDDMVATDTLAPPRSDRAAAARAPWAEPEVTPQAEEVVIGRDQR
jgi:multicomponent Na+:H+ antiporter subunit C